MKIAVIGAGAMGGAFIDGLLASRAVEASDIVVANPTEGKLLRFAEKGVRVTTSNVVAAKAVDIVVVAVKPWLVESVMQEIAPAIAGRKVILVSFAAGGPLPTSPRGGGEGPGVITVIPNIAIAQRQSMTFIAGGDVPEDDVCVVKTLFDQLGQTRLVNEKQLRAGTILASCGIAYAMRYIRAAAEGGVEIGFRADEAKDIVLQTVKGAVELLQATGEHPEQAIDRVTTPGGITIRGLNAMEQAGFTKAVIEGLKIRS
ncbi:MAG: pyrroline-5-carboxylate reductase [Prevotella sp.]|nr:pyrroline-5-carboxylate reductase [Prevotella sp.]